MRELGNAAEWRHGGSGVGAGSARCLSAVDWRTLGMLRGMLAKREDERARGARTKGVVTGDETSPTATSSLSLSLSGTLALPHVEFSIGDAASRVSATIFSGDRDVTRGDLTLVAVYIIGTVGPIAIRRR